MTGRYFAVFAKMIKALCTCEEGKAKNLMQRRLAYKVSIVHVGGSKFNLE